MSFIQSRIRCNHCQTEMNVAFGIVGTSIIAEWPKQCPKCGLGQFTKIADCWTVDLINPATPSTEATKEPT